jgi:hypothetical protein
MHTFLETAAIVAAMTISSGSVFAGTLTIANPQVGSAPSVATQATPARAATANDDASCKWVVVNPVTEDFPDEMVFTFSRVEQCSGDAQKASTAASASDAPGRL